MANQPAVAVRGLAEFRRDIRRADTVVGKELQRDLKDVAQKVADEAAALAPRRTGHMASLYRGAAVGARGLVRNREFYSRFIEFGFHPGGGSRFVAGQNVIGRAIERQEDNIVDGIGDAVERAALKMGWR